MKWQAGKSGGQPDVDQHGQPYWWRSDCGRFTICRIYVLGEWQFEAWRKLPDGQAFLIEGHLDHPKKAQNVCKAVADGTYHPTAGQ